MAKAYATLAASQGNDLILAARNTARFQEFAKDLEIRYKIAAELLEADLLKTAGIRAMEKQQVQTVVCFAGIMPQQSESTESYDIMKKVIDTNFTAPARVLETMAYAMAARGTGTVVGVSSVAGERGRQSNYTYGSAKAGFTAFLSGLRNAMSKKGVHVVTVKPGFVHTAMTEGMDLPGALTAEPAQVAQAIAKAIRKKKNVIYTLWMWRYVMLIIRNIPEFIFKKLSL